MRRRFKIGARDSLLSRAQAEEVVGALGVDLEVFWFKTRGDRDLATSLKNVSPGNFFTAELDEALLSKTIDAAVHSAKDLPPLLPEGLELACLTLGRSTHDVLLLREGERLEDLLPNTLIATSTTRREEAVRALLPHATFRDIRGTIDQRIQQLNEKKFDGLVVAACALERLHIDAKTYPLKGPTARYQGRLAIVCRKDDERVKACFAPLNTKKTLFFGTTPRPNSTHVPLIQTVPRSIEEHFLAIERANIFIITSPSAAAHFAQALPLDLLKICKEKLVVAIGKATAATLDTLGFKMVSFPTEETSDGVIDLLRALNLAGKTIFYPHSSRSSPIIRSFLKKRGVPCTNAILYDTYSIPPKEPVGLETFDELYFSSPSTVDAFFEFFHTLPESMFIKTEGSVTRAYLEKREDE